MSANLLKRRERRMDIPRVVQISVLIGLLVRQILYVSGRRSVRAEGAKEREYLASVMPFTRT
jgi:hypothetical protein